MTWFRSTRFVGCCKRLQNSSARTQSFSIHCTIPWIITENVGTSVSTTRQTVDNRHNLRYTRTKCSWQHRPSLLFRRLTAHDANEWRKRTLRRRNFLIVHQQAAFHLPRECVVVFTWCIRIIITSSYAVTLFTTPQKLPNNIVEAIIKASLWMVKFSIFDNYYRNCGICCWTRYIINLWMR